MTAHSWVEHSEMRSGETPLVVAWREPMAILRFGRQPLFFASDLSGLADYLDFENHQILLALGRAAY